ncbi:polyketide synthase [Diplogelasinospora grovesii]|uniref:Polyketide synthase n=1 Tax=Diplogelasinospora grovesii TaxID=303347 RepID=A0AAN6RZJ5_9PEZI|nr:polyketide synthase [Diplogelasinospora grovesii]
MLEPIAVIGTGCRFPGGADTASRLWSVIHHPRDLSRKPPAARFNVDAFYHPEGIHHGTTNATRSYFLDDKANESSVEQFDAAFFNIQAAEAEAMDPQQRLLLEVVYEGLCAGGQRLEALRGSDTAVYVGMMCDDYNTMVRRDWETLPRYTATGLCRAIHANRVSYFFDWHGPSVTVDTACSSSLIALDLAVQALRSGKAKMAVAAGTNLILTPDMYISESKLGMLSPTGRCAMWDVGADGYTRGEGVAAVFVKTLSQALADNDPIECVIRETAVNQDGRTPGLTMPNNAAQAALVRSCYARAGLDPLNHPEDRPQFFHAHGTGTQAGDAQEAEAISKSFFRDGSSAPESKLLVGSIKTVIGHTEGTAGVASVIGTMMALKNRTIPPNLHFHSLSPKVSPHYQHLQIPTAPVPWVVPDGVTRRASVNSFGFGGTNAHCILKEYVPNATGPKSAGVNFTPLTFSAASATALRSMLSQHLNYLQSKPEAHLDNLAYTLQHRRSTLAHRTAIVATTAEQAVQSLSAAISKENTDADTRYKVLQSPAKILGIFTGQGAQWARIGAELVELSPFASARIDELDAFLQSLPNAENRPAWTLKEQLLAGQETSRIAEAAFSQPLCTAIQILLVDVLNAAGVRFAAVVGHSSGEIGAAYAAGLVSARDAILIAYFRGVHAKLASSPSPQAPGGAMLAVGTSFVDAQVLCEDAFAGRLQVAAVNSDSSVTLSGDGDAIDEAEQLLKIQGTFARKLKVDTAYHSAHMASCAGPYLASLKGCSIAPTVGDDGRPMWFSSVYCDGEAMSSARLANQYWVDNMCNTVLFAPALRQAIQDAGEFNLAIEIGPHPALKGPATSVLEGFGSAVSIPYTGLLSRGSSDVGQLSTGLGYVWTKLGSDSVDFTATQRLLSGTEACPVALSDLPPYPFDHVRAYWINNRLANHFKQRGAVHEPNPLLGAPCHEAVTSGEFQWRNILRPSEIAWLKGHMLQGQIVFPATGYVCMAVEAMKTLAFDLAPGTFISLFKLNDVELPRAIAFDDDTASVETIFAVTSMQLDEKTLTANWACYSTAKDGSAKAVMNAKGRASCYLSDTQADALPLVQADPYNLTEVDRDSFYTNLSRVGYGYSTPFCGISEIRRKLGYSVGTLLDQSGSTWDDNMLLHPGTLDSALQTLFAAWFYPGDSQLWSLHVPVSFSSVVVNPHFTSLGAAGKQSSICYETRVRNKDGSRIVGDIMEQSYIYLNTQDSSHAFVQFEGATLVPFSPANPRNDVPMFSRFQYDIAAPDGQLAAAGELLSDSDVRMFKDVDRISYWFARNASLSIPAMERHGLLPHYQNYLAWCDRMVDMVTRNAHPKVSAACNVDSRGEIADILARYKGRKDFRFVEVVGDNLVPVIRAGNTMLDVMNQDGLLRAFYAEDSICSGPTGRWLANIVAQISHRFPGLRILEVGAGTGATTSLVLRALDGAYASYTFTDISSAFFLPAEELFGRQDSRLIFRTFNMEKDPVPQGYVEGTYDVIVAVNVLHVSSDMRVTLRNVRRLLKPGGYLVVGELTSTDLLFSGMTVGTLPGWWIGADSGRPWGPLFTLAQWDALLKDTGFAGIDTVTPDISGSLPVSVFVAQAVDDQVLLLRQPLSVEDHPAGVRTDALAIIGGATWPVYKLCHEVSDIIGTRFLRKAFFESIEDFACSDMARSDWAVTVLSVTDLEKPFLEDMTESKFEALKTLLVTAGTMVWVTCGLREDTPFSGMMAGLTNTVKTEQPNLNVQMYDLDQDVGGVQSNTARDLAETLLRQLFLHHQGTNTETLLWTAEPQVFVKSGKQLITRIIPDKEKNERYNSKRRDILASVDPASDGVQLLGVTHGHERAIELRKSSPLRDTKANGPEVRIINVMQSVLQSVAIAGMSGYFRLCVGVEANTKEKVLALTSCSESPALVPATSCISLEEVPTASRLVAVAAMLIADHILALAPNGCTVLVNDADTALQIALEGKKREKKLDLVFTSSQLFKENQAVKSVFLHPNFPHHAIQSVVPTSTALYVHFSRGDSSEDVGKEIEKSLPRACLRLQEDSLLSHEVSPSARHDPGNILAQLLERAYGEALSLDFPSIETIAIGNVSSHKAIGEALSVVDWTANAHAMAKVQPIDSGLRFRGDRTYLLLSMAGEIGQSVAEWMVCHGARCVVLSSRSPKVNPEFIFEMEKQYGATIKPMSLDITSREALWAAHATMVATLPPIAGVVNGALVLDDSLIANMKFEQYTRVTRPKVFGTQLLDELFYQDTTLDFFIVASSIASVIGWSGQSNYAAANDFMTSLVAKRRKRGVAGSAINIPAVLGIGYAAHSETFDFDAFAALGYINIGEEDLHALIAEGILAGRPGAAGQGTAQVAMGVNFLPVGFQVAQAHRRDVKFSQFILYEDAGSEVKSSKGAVERVKTQLQRAKSGDEYFVIVRDAFLIHLKRLLRIPEQQELTDAETLVELGVDSLIAVDIRSWFLKEVEAHVPTLKILGGGTIASLVHASLKESFALPSATHASEPGQDAQEPRSLEDKESRSTLDKEPASDESSRTHSPVFTPWQEVKDTPFNTGSMSSPASSALSDGKEA